MTVPPSADTLADHLAPVRPGLAPLVPAEALEAVAAVARRLPGAASSTFGFECRIGAGPVQTDLLVSLRGGRGRRELVALTRHGAGPGTARLRAFADAWASPASGLHRALDNVWLEFDVADAAGADAQEADGVDKPADLAPSVFFGFPAPAVEPRPEERGEARAHALATTRSALGLLAGSAVEGGRLEVLERCFTVPGRAAEVFQVGMMLSRTPLVVRLCLRLESARDILPVLRHTGWRGEEAALLRAFGEVAEAANYVCLDLDLDAGAGVQPKVGLECYAVGPGRWRQLLAALVRSGLCTDRQAAALLAYPGHRLQEPGDGTWPHGLGAAAGLLGPRSTGLLATSLHHVKVVHSPGSDPAAKAYLAVNYRWLTRDGVDKE